MVGVDVMENIFNITNVRGYVNIAPLIGFLSPTNDFLLGLVICFGFNIWCGLRADGVTMLHCKKFSGKKFKDSLIELLTYIAIIYVIFSSMTLAGDERESIIVIKILSYIFMGFYIQNGFNNLIQAYPKNKAYRAVYHFMRMEFKRMMPEYVQSAIDKYNKQNESENETK